MAAKQQWNPRHMSGPPNIFKDFQNPYDGGMLNVLSMFESLGVF